MSNIDTSSWQKFKVGDLFEASNGDMDIKKSDLDGQGLPVVTSGVANYGIAGRSSVVAREFDANTITVDMFGNVMYRSEPYKMVMHARVFSLALKDEYPMSEQVGLYLVGALSKLTGGYGFNDMCSWSKICDKSILLPAKVVYEPDWDYMAERIAELEAERIGEIEAYLVATGLDDCELTDEDREVLGRDVETRAFRVGDLFEVLTGRRKLSKRDFECDGTVPIYSSDTRNGGIIGWTNSGADYAVSDDIACYVLFGDHTKTFRIIRNDFCTADNVKVMIPRWKAVDEELLYVFTIWGKAIPSLGYARHWSKANIASITLPVTPSGTPDWDYMRAYIRAQEKLVMAGVADMTQKRIDATRAIVGA